MARSRAAVASRRAAGGAVPVRGRLARGHHAVSTSPWQLGTVWKPLGESNQQVRRDRWDWSPSTASSSPRTARPGGLRPHTAGEGRRVSGVQKNRLHGSTNGRWRRSGPGKPTAVPGGVLKRPTDGLGGDYLAGHAATAPALDRTNPLLLIARLGSVPGQCDRRPLHGKPLVSDPALVVPPAANLWTQPGDRSSTMRTLVSKLFGRPDGHKLSVAIRGGAERNHGLACRPSLSEGDDPAARRRGRGSGSRFPISRWQIVRNGGSCPDDPMSCW